MTRRVFMQLWAGFLALFGLGINEAKAKTHLSTKILVLVDGKVVGTINRLNVEETEYFVTRQNHYNIKADRITFDKMRISEAFSRGYCHAKAQRKPLQIEVSDQLNQGERVTTHIQNAWVEKIGGGGAYDKGIDIGDSILVHDVRMQCEDVWSDLNG
jgi:hypothetical protein